MTEIETPAGLNDRSFIIAWNRKLRLQQVSIWVDWGNKWWYKYPGSFDVSSLLYLVVGFIHSLCLSFVVLGTRGRAGKKKWVRDAWKKKQKLSQKSPAHTCPCFIGQSSILQLSLRQWTQWYFPVSFRSVLGCIVKGENLGERESGSTSRGCCYCLFTEKEMDIWKRMMS